MSHPYEKRQLNTPEINVESCNSLRLLKMMHALTNISYRAIPQQMGTNHSNVTVAMNETSSTLDDSGKISDNPLLYMYATVYSMTAVAVVISLCVRGFAHMKVQYERGEAFSYLKEVDL